MYRQYAGLFFCLCVDVNDNDLAYMEAIHNFVEVLNEFFTNVCELDLLFNFYKVYSLVDEMFLAGEIQETAPPKVRAPPWRPLCPCGMPWQLTGLPRFAVHGAQVGRALSRAGPHDIVCVCAPALCRRCPPAGFEQAGPTCADGLDPSPYPHPYVSFFILLLPPSLSLSPSMSLFVSRPLPALFHTHATRNHMNSTIRKRNRAGKHTLPPRGLFWLRWVSEGQVCVVRCAAPWWLGAG